MKTNSTNTKLKQLIESTSKLKEIKFEDNYVLNYTKYIVENKPKQGEVNWTKDYVRSPFESVQHQPNLAIYTDNMWCVDIDYKLSESDEQPTSRFNKPYEILKILVEKNLPFIGQISTSGLHLFFKQPSNWEKFIFKPDPTKHFKKSVMSILGYEYELLSPSKVTVKIKQKFRKWFGNFTESFTFDDFKLGELPEIPEFLLPISGLKSVNYDKSPEMIGFLQSGIEAIGTGNRHNTFFKLVTLCKNLEIIDPNFIINYINSRIYEKYDDKILKSMIKTSYDYETPESNESLVNFDWEKLLKYTPMTIYDHLEAKKELEFLISVVSGLDSYEQILELSKKSINSDLVNTIFKDYDKLDIKPTNYLVLESLTRLASFYRLRDIKPKMTQHYQKTSAMMLLKIWENWMSLKNEDFDELGIKEFLEKVSK